MNSRPASITPALFAIFVLTTTFACGGTDADAPRLVVDDDVVDFGALFADEMRRHVFTLRNEGRSLLKVHRVKKDCGCLQPKVSRTEIPPGESATLTVDFKPPVLGTIAKRVWVYTNDPDGETILRLRAEGQGVARLTPRVIRLPEIYASHPDGVVPLDVTMGEGRHLEGVRFATSGPGLRFESLPRERSHQASFRLHLPAYREPRSLRETIPVFVTVDGDPNPKRLALPLQIIGRSAPRLWCRPCVLHLGTGAGGAKQTASFSLEGEGDLVPGWRPVWRGPGEAALPSRGTSSWSLELTLPRAAGRVVGRIEWLRDRASEGQDSEPAPAPIRVHAWSEGV